MATDFNGEGNIGTDPEYKEFPNGDKEPRRLLRLNVYFDNSIPATNGGFEDKGGFWANVDWWHRDAEHFASLFAKGQRVLIFGRVLLEQWVDDRQEQQAAIKVRADRVAILPHRVASVSMQPKTDRVSPQTA
ncbi:MULTISPECIES: single-stranded DNA-binding protein [Pseudomonas syringae group genomosp. 2]|uniref:Uncharacterized protein n=1 Tax=Pseudomonas amygdali pv. ulmi TaxID=251720 RepID=A0A0Q0DVW1_PSEA0|nr:MULTISPECIES: single-stranded DNA-binding protein [Pseudomonas syringae group genomosp. 2]KPX35937.1 hypothetical protein ALO69_200025 [Pseudomonas ficuserectae]KPZ12426.1 hypothetical protein ALO41_200238 [Pseudomonas amygdali pv. ulmi]KWS16888.1 single-stranded DNA-binding protein [Pseudomonas amygdali pv. ulmi]PAB28788.1 single-stranded DNA-binding protein [Pseudomonas savastanoi pv. fraxini]PPS24593.1 single-stranded DNA-binding protein [Pseudomonas amygdali pv. morsprunorum]